MRYYFLVLLSLITTAGITQSPGTTTQSKISLVENSLTPAVVYGDTLPRLNLEAQMKQYGVKGLSIAVIDNYKIVWSKGYGWADEQRKLAVNENTRFQAASISKSLNSLGLLKLVQQKKILPDADINTYLKSWKFPYDSLSGGKKITLYDLLSHTAGVSVHGFWGYGPAGPFPTVKQILNGETPSNSKAVRSMFPPGQRFQYAGGGTTITQLMLTDVTGQDYATYMQREVLSPLGMKKSFFNQPPPNDLRDLAIGYVNDKPVDGGYHVYPEQAAAGLWTTPSDIARYIIETQLALEKKSAKVLNHHYTQQRFIPRTDSTFGLGLFIENRDGYQYFNHNGGNYGYVCTYYGSMKDGKGVVVMTNGDKFQVINELVNSVALVYNWNGFFKPTFIKPYSVPADTLAAYFGYYKLGTDTIGLIKCGDALCVTQNGQPENGMKTVFTDALNFSFPDVPGATIRMIYKEGKVSSFELKQGGVTMTAARMNEQ